MMDSCVLGGVFMCELSRCLGVGLRVVLMVCVVLEGECVWKSPRMMMCVSGNFRCTVVVVAL